MFKSIGGGMLPERATKFSAGFDVSANEDVIIGAGETVLVGLGICLDGVLMDDMVYKKFGLDVTSDDFKTHYYLELHPRSSLRAKGLGGGVGIIDMDYRDEIKMVIHNPNSVWTYNSEDECKVGSVGKCYEIKRGDKIGQLLLKRHEGWLFPSEYTKDEERMGGFGSTNKKEEEQK